MAKRKHSCCGRKFRNESALNQHTRDMHPGRRVKAERPRKGRTFFAGFFGSMLGVFVALAAAQVGARIAQEGTEVVKTVHTVRH